MTYDPKAFWSARLEHDFSLSGVGYIGLGSPFNEALYAQRERVLRRLLRRERIGVRGATIVEFGPGTGFYTAIFEREGARMVEGFDITAVSARALAARFPQYRFACADISEPLPVAPGAADIVAAFDVLFHVADETRFGATLRNAAAALRPGGVLLVSDLFLHVAPTTTAAYYVPRTLARWEAALDDAGFEVVRRTPIFVTMHPPLDASGRTRRVLERIWVLASTRLKEHPDDGRWIGAALGLADRLLCRLVSDGPSTEFLVARRR